MGVAGVWVADTPDWGYVPVDSTVVHADQHRVGAVKWGAVADAILDEAIAAAISGSRGRRGKAIAPYGDGDAADKIVAVLDRP